MSECCHLLQGKQIWKTNLGVLAFHVPHISQKRTLTYTAKKSCGVTKHIFACISLSIVAELFPANNSEIGASNTVDGIDVTLSIVLRFGTMWIQSSFAVGWPPPSALDTQPPVPMVFCCDVGKRNLSAQTSDTGRWNLVKIAIKNTVGNTLSKKEAYFKK